MRVVSKMAGASVDYEKVRKNTFVLKFNKNEGKKAEHSPAH